VIGFGDFEVSRCCIPALTTVSVDGALIGRETGLLLIDALGRVSAQVSRRAPQRVRVDAILTPRGSTR
jgi:LacI family gluconate utilization system Gnt-I transcriptional repressor